MLIVLCLSALVFAFTPGSASGATEGLGAAAESTKATLQQAGTAAVNEIDEVWRRIDETRLKNRTRDEIVAWVIVGLLVSNVVGLFSASNPSRAQRFGMLLLGLAGAFMGGIITHVFRLNFGMGPLLIRYEDLLISVIGGVVFLIAVRLLIAHRRKKALMRASQAIAKPAAAK